MIIAIVIIPIKTIYNHDMLCVCCIFSKCYKWSLNNFRWMFIWLRPLSEWVWLLSQEVWPLRVLILVVTLSLNKIFPLSGSNCMSSQTSTHLYLQIRGETFFFSSQHSFYLNLHSPGYSHVCIPLSGMMWLFVLCTGTCRERPSQDCSVIASV